MIVEVVGAVIRDATGRLLTVRKRRTQPFMLPGGKREPGEDDLTALARELDEELGVTMASAHLLGRFEAAAANEPGATVRSSAYIIEIKGEIAVLTAQQRLSGYIVSGLPLFIILALFVIAPTYISKLFLPGIARMMLAAGGFGMLAGFYALKRIADIDV